MGGKAGKMSCNSAFVPGIQVLGSSSFRRPRVHACNCSRHVLPNVSRKGRFSNIPIKMSNGQSEEDQSSNFDLQTNSNSFISSPQRGFALQDAPKVLFTDLEMNSEPLATGGAYAIRDDTGEIMYMGYSKNVASKLSFHAKLLPDKCSSFQVYIPPVPPELISAEMLENVLEYWVRETGSLPNGNTVDRELWEQEDTKKKQTRNNTTVNNVNTNSINSKNEIPVRDRTTPRRVSTRKNPTQYYGQPKTSFDEAFKQSSRNTRRAKATFFSNSVESDDDYVDVDVDPLDPFSASKSRPNYGVSWDAPDFTDEDVKEEWFPILILMGTAGLVWLCGVLTTALPASNPSLGM